MPNHVHGILIVNNKIQPSHKCVPVETNCNLSLQKKPKQHGTSQTIGSIIRGFKIGVTKYARVQANNYLSLSSIWQPNYHDRIIRNEKELNKIREYIIYNPQNWEKDDLY